MQGNIHSTQELGCGYLMGSHFGAYTDTIGMSGKYLMSLKVPSISHHQTIKGDGEQFPYPIVILRKRYHGRSNKHRSLVPPTPKLPYLAQYKNVTLKGYPDKIGFSLL